MSVIIGLTGPTGSGKSTAAKAAASVGLTWVDCDLLARKAVEKGTCGLQSIVTAFGSDILFPDGTLNRKALAKAAFKDKESTDLLNKTLLPHISEIIKKEINNSNCLLDAPTLFESGINSLCVKTIAVLADEKVRRKRIIVRDSLTEEEANLRISAGKSEEFYFHKADYILYNNNNENEFLTQFIKVINEIMEASL